ncbi:unnamed protein product [Arctogadus glacialis]
MTGRRAALGPNTGPQCYKTSESSSPPHILRFTIVSSQVLHSAGMGTFNHTLETERDLQEDGVVRTRGGVGRGASSTPTPSPMATPA